MGCTIAYGYLRSCVLRYASPSKQFDEALKKQEALPGPVDYDLLRHMCDLDASGHVSAFCDGLLLYVLAHVLILCRHRRRAAAPKPLLHIATAYMVLSYGIWNLVNVVRYL